MAQLPLNILYGMLCDSLIIYIITLNDVRHAMVADKVHSLGICLLHEGRPELILLL